MTATKPSQVTMYYQAVAKMGERDAAFFELMNHPTNPLTKRDLAANIKRRPAVWERYAGYMDQLPA